MRSYKHKNIIRFFAFLLCNVMLFPLAACNGSGETSKPDDNSNTSDITSEAESSEQLIPSEKAAKVWDEAWVDEAGGFADETTIYGFDFYKNRELSEDDATELSDEDYKYIFYGEDKSRAVNLSDGYAITLQDKDFTPDYSLSGLRSRYYGDNYVLTVTKENKSPYGNTEEGWDIYLNEWLIRFIDNVDFLSSNGIRSTRVKQENTELIDGYTVLTYNLAFLLGGKYEYPYYDIAIVRKNDEYVNFYLFVMKSKEKQYEKLDEIVKSFVEFDSVGTSENDMTPYELKIPENWSEETKAYYEKLRTQSGVDWGMFVGSMPDDNSSNYTNMLNKITTDQNRLSDAMDHDFELMPTYTHIGWDQNLWDFPSQMAEELAGGNGFNGKPVLHFTYQYTTYNNGNLEGYTPMFDIIAGDYDDHFRELAKAIKEYGKPVLFRLNNEMNTDWVSYCGMVTLLDPDIFIDSWRRLYDIFEEEGVDNCIWVFNPIAKSCPYSNWGEMLCYMPGEDYMQMMGLTHYEMNNNGQPQSFRDMYTYVYEQNTPYFEDYPWIIGEFACGAGGEVLYDWSTGKYNSVTLGRYQSSQAAWVEDMFEILNDKNNPSNEFAKNIVGAIWFSTNDYVSVDSESKIINYLSLDSELTQTLEAFKNGLSE